ncbi:hypothetical protein [Martelella endophytica]|uniref:Uncharacterized protein n=1 Tax=Martelella endophytica TaxID=1486262 RepID=A0A0D5LUM1_MAREN|nr:hypothetical protein [Martelella endophytica]AJY47053.1 hypothetical protein TM49_17410 [Martelella endophytica]
METMQDSMSKAEFASLISVSAGRVSQYLSAGQIHGRAIEGEGRFARIRPDVAIAQLGLTIDPCQGFGANGKASTASCKRQADFPRAGRRAGAAAELPLRPLPVEDEEEDLAEQLARERLQQQKYKTAQMERQEKAEEGIYTRTEDVRREIGRTSSEAFKVMEQGIPDLAGALAEDFNLPQRDIQKTLTRKWRDIRQKAAEAFRVRRDEEPELTEEEADDA